MTEREFIRKWLECHSQDETLARNVTLARFAWRETQLALDAALQAREYVGQPIVECPVLGPVYVFVSRYILPRATPSLTEYSELVSEALDAYQQRTKRR